jgi:sortase A
MSTLRSQSAAAWPRWPPAGPWPAEPPWPVAGAGGLRGSGTSTDRRREGRRGRRSSRDGAGLPRLLAGKDRLEDERPGRREPSLVPAQGRMYRGAEAPAADRPPREDGSRSARRRPRHVALLVALFAAAGVAVTLDALWIPAKAALAQVLLERAWEEVRRGAPEGSAATRPWPWADTWPVARLTLPGGEPMVVLAGASGRTLAFGPGHLDGSARPGEGGHVVVAGHRDTHFRALAGLAPGDEVEVEDAAGGRRRYAVRGAAVVDHRDTSMLADGGDRLTLVTCWPFDALHPGGPLRYVVRTEAVAPPRLTSPAG